jgi:hypothetical protein
MKAKMRPRSIKPFNLLRKPPVSRIPGGYPGIVGCTLGPLHDKHIPMRFESGTLVITLRGETGHYTRKGEWIQFNGAVNNQLAA